MRRELKIAALKGPTGSLRVGFAGADGASRGTLVILPGRAEFIEKYAETVDGFCDLGFAVALVEWRGQGLSERGKLYPHRGYIADFDDYLLDLESALDHLDTLVPPRPFVMLAHSMGGHIGLRWLHREPDRFAAAVMTAPMFGIPLASIPEPAARFLGWAAVRFGARWRYAPGQSDFLLDRCLYDSNPLTSCPIRFQGFRDLLAGKPELALGGATWGWLDACLRSMALTRAPGYLESIATPILLCMADADRVISNVSIELFARLLPHATLRRFDHARHELLIERDEIRDQVLAEIDSFLAAAAPPVSQPSHAAGQPPG